MKKILLFLFLISTAFMGRGQNLVPNGDFEQFSGCPDDFSEIDSALFWINPNLGTPDYYNQCSNSPYVDVPDNFWGYQPARSGNAYSGIFIWVTNGPVREYIEAPLTTTLIANNCYHFEMYVNLPNSCQYTADAIGIHFTDTLLTGINNFNPLPFIPQINNTAGNIPDTLNWVLISGNYTATGGENYLIIGNYKNDATTNPVLINSTGSWPGAYFFIDDVCLAPCVSSCATAIEEQNQNDAIKIFPNPAKDFINISFALKEEKNVSVEVYDLYGRKVFEKELQTSNTKLQTQIDMRSFPGGVYFIKLNMDGVAEMKKVIKVE